MTNLFFEKPILNAPYACPSRHWELDKNDNLTEKTEAKFDKRLINAGVGE
jgi:type III restriction enzyme